MPRITNARLSSMVGFIPYHRAHPEVSLSAHLAARAEQLAEQVIPRTCVCLDTKYWILFAMPQWVVFVIRCTGMGSNLLLTNFCFHPFHLLLEAFACELLPHTCTGNSQQKIKPLVFLKKAHRFNPCLTRNAFTRNNAEGPIRTGENF